MTDRAGRVRDPQGNLWWVMARIEDVSEGEMNRRWAEPKYTAVMEQFSEFDPFPPNAAAPITRTPGMAGT